MVVNQHLKFFGFKKIIFDNSFGNENNTLETYLPCYYVYFYGGHNHLAVI